MARSKDNKIRIFDVWFFCLRARLTEKTSTNNKKQNEKQQRQQQQQQQQ